MRVYTSFRSKRFAKHLGHMYFRARLVRNFEAYVRAKAKQRRKQPASFLLSHCNNNGDVFYVAQTASTLAQGWRRNESCCETVAAMIQGSSSLFLRVFFFGAALRSFHEHVLFLPRLASDRPFSLTRSARVVNVIRDRSRKRRGVFTSRIFSSAAD